MIELLDIRYARLGTENLDEAVRYATEIIGLEISHRDEDTVYLKSDDRDHTLCYFKGAPGDHTVGFEVASASALDAAEQALRTYTNGGN